MIDTQLAAAINFTAFGVNLFGAIVLLLLNAGSRSVRWYLPFQLCVMLWLFSAAVTFTWRAPVWVGVQAFAVAAMPMMFLVFALMESSQRPAWHAMLIMAASAPLVPVVMSGTFLSQLSRTADAVAMTWMVLGWMGGSLILWRQGRRQARQQPEQPQMRRRIVLLAFVLIAPVSVVTAIIAEGAWFIVFIMPVITMWIMLLIFYGITRLQFYDIEVRARRAGAVAAETFETGRLAVVGGLAATIAHEVRNPLTGVRSLAQRIADDEVPADKRKQYAQVILQETGRVETLISKLLDLSRRTGRTADSAAARTPLAPLFDDLRLLVGSRAAAKQVTLRITTDDPITVASPREVVTQAVLNLLLNAIAHAPPASMVELSATSAGERVRITVRDRGPGVPAAERERIFEPFYTTRAEGTGLGLSVVRHIAREQEWQVSITDAPGGGAEFMLVLS